MASVSEQLGRIVYGRHFDADEARDHPDIFKARMDGLAAANRRWSLWLQAQGYTPAQAGYIISQDMDDA